MKDFDIRIRNGGDDAIAAVSELTAHLEGEIERLRSLTRLQDGVIRSGDVACLTELERASITRAIETLQGVEYLDAFSTENDATAAATLRGLLERLAT